MSSDDWCYLIIKELELGEKPTVCDMSSIVESCPSASDRLKHVCRNGRIVDVTADFAAPDILEQRQREGVPHRVKVDVGAKFGQCFQAFEEIVFDEPFLLTCCFN